MGGAGSGGCSTSPSAFAVASSQGRTCCSADASAMPRVRARVPRGGDAASPPLTPHGPETAAASGRTAAAAFAPEPMGSGAVEGRPNRASVRARSAAAAFAEALFTRAASEPKPAPVEVVSLGITRCAGTACDDGATVHLKAPVEREDAIGRTEPDAGRPDAGRERTSTPPEM